MAAIGVLAEEAVRIRADTSGFHSGVEKGVLGSVTKVAASAAAIFGGVQLGKGLFNATIKSAADFQMTLKVLQATTHASDADLKRLSATAQKLGADVSLPSVSAKTAADAMLQLGRAGFSTNQTIAATRGVLLLATAAEVDNATAADMVSKAIGAFGLQAKDAGTVVNDFAGAANASQSSLADVGEAMTQAGAGFHALRIPVSDAATAIAEMAKQGITGGMAGAALNTAFTRLATPTKAAKDLMKDMGVQLFDNNGKFVGLRAAIEQMSPKLAKMTDQQRLHTLSVLGGTRGMKALADVLGVGVKEWDHTHAAVTRAGQAQEIANAKMSGFNGAVKNLQNTLGALALKIGIAVLPKVTELVRWLGRIAAAPNMSVAIKIAWSGIKGFAEDVAKQVGDALFGSTRVVHIGGHSTGVEVDPGLIAKIGDAISTGVEATDWSKVGKAIGDAISAAIKITNDALDGMLNQMTAWVSAHKSQIADIGLVIGLTMISKLLDPGFWAAHWQLIGGIVLSAITLLFPEGKLAEIGVRGVGFLLKPFSALGSKLAALGVEGVLGLSGSIERAIGPLAGKISLWIGDAILRATGAAVRGMVDLGAKIITALINKVSGLNVLFRTAIFTAVVAVIGNLIGAAVSGAEKLAASVAKGILTFPSHIDFRAVLVTAVLGPLGVVAGLAGPEAQKIALNIANAIKTAPAKLAGLAGDLSSKIGSIAGQVAGSAFSLMRQIGFSIADGILSGVGNLASRLAGKLGDAISSAKGYVFKKFGISSPSKVFHDEVGQPIMQGIIAGVESLADKLGNTVNTSVTTAMSRGGEAVLKATPAMTAAFGAWAKAVEAKVMAAFATMHAKVDAEFASAQAKLDKWRASATPTEALIASLQARAELAAVNNAVAAAKSALNQLDADFQASWAKLLADQAKNMAKLKATQAGTVTDKDIAGHEFDKTQAATASDPLAVNLLNARKDLDTVKALYAQGTATQAELFAAQDAYDTASAKAADDANATKLLSDYDTWQGLVQQAADGAQAIVDQEATDAEARKTATDGYNEARKTDEQAIQDAITALQAYNMGVQATAERADRETRYAELSTGLKARYDRIDLHLNNVAARWKTHFDNQVEAAGKRGKEIADAYTEAIQKLSDPKGNLADALNDVAKLVAKYLKLNSPAEVGPLSDLDRWWTKFAATLLQGFDDSPVKARLAETAVLDAQSLAGPGRLAAGQGRNLSSEQTWGRIEQLLARIEKHTGTTASKPDAGAPIVSVTGATVDLSSSVHAAKR